MIKKGDILTKKPSYQLLNARFYHTSDVLDAMQEYAEEYHKSEMEKLNKNSLNTNCKKCNGLTSVPSFGNFIPCDECNK